ncbi:MAG: CpaF family protein [Lachnospiraceae bacterium]|jgi:pilus assembly protein CpaF|nr:CpaF family protein [Lachnospiraceae bacterium]
MPGLDHTLRSRVLEQLDRNRDVEDEVVRACVRREVCRAGREQPLSVQERQELEETVFNSLRKLDILQELLDDEDITEIMVNGPDQIFLEKKGQIYLSDRKFASEERLMDVIQQIAAANNQIISESSPILDTRIHGERVCIVLPPIGIDHPILSIRKFPKEPITMDRLLATGSMSEEIAEFLKKAVEARYNIFISGGTSSGKTTFLNALTEFIPRDQRVITIEDSAELVVLGIPNLIRLESRNKTLEGKLEVTIRDLVRTSLRLRPDRIIVGECRGGETLDMIQAMATGHPGSLSTGHANSARDMLSRLEVMVLMGGNADLPLLAIRQQIAAGIDLIIHLARLRDRSRRLIEITELDGMENGEIRLNRLYRLKEEREEGESYQWVKEGELIHSEKMTRAGFSTW